MKEKLKICIGIIVVIVILGLIGFIGYKAISAKKAQQSNPVATFELENYGTVKMELYPEYAPNTVANFIALINSGYYNNKILFGKDSICLYMGRDADEEAKGPKISLIDNSIEADSDEDYVYEINGEFIANGFEANTLRHEKGVISLNRYDYSYYGLTEESYNSGNAQFSIMMEDASNLNGVYCAFGKVTEGFEILENIYNNAEIAINEETTEENSEEVESEESEEDESAIKEFATAPVITSATVETYGVDYGVPQTHEAFDIQSYINQLYSNYYSN